jgi:alpha-ketoglutaric semialdehyde dehydrogenase
MTATLQHLVAGRWYAGAGDTLRSLNPAHPAIAIAEGGVAGATDVDDAVAAAAEARSSWAATPIHQRGAVLSAAADIVERNADAWGVELASEEGKTKAEAVGEVRRAAQILRYYGNEGDRQTGEIFASPRAGEQILVTRKPVGVVGVITPFNFPIAIPAWKIAPALVYGNTVVWKPASTVPLLAIRLAEALCDGGLPAGVLNLLIGGSDIGDAIVGHGGIDAVTFTGSTGIGRRIASAAAARGVPVQAEMGGKNAAVVLDDADMDLALDQVMLGAFRSTGQKCTATSRLIITDGIADRFLEALTERARALVVGDPTEEKTQMGPVVNESALKSIQAGIEGAAAQGATMLTGGEPYPEGPLTDGYFVAPTIVELDGTAADVWTDELFGPVLAVHRASDADEAIIAANDSEFGLSAAIFTQDLTRVLHAVDQIDVGVLHVNSESAGADPHVPFGGAKKSGLGPKEQGGAAREFFTHTTTVYLRGGSPGA